MTTIVAVKKNGYAAIAADTLTTFGNTRLQASQDASHDKILRIGDSYVGVCGSAAHQLVLSSLLTKTPDAVMTRHREASGTDMAAEHILPQSAGFAKTSDLASDVGSPSRMAGSSISNVSDVQLNSKEAIFETFRKLHPILKEECFLNPKEDEEDPYESSQITALIANSSGIFAIYSMREVFEYTQYWAIGSGHEFALGAMHQVYARSENAMDIARAGVETGIAFDKNSDSPITIYSVKLA